MIYILNYIEINVKCEIDFLELFLKKMERLVCSVIFVYIDI